MTPAYRRGVFIVVAIAFVARLSVVAWAASRIPPAADGAYYHLLATRLAAGQGYTWLWPDGAVTYAAHYPVGYPLVLAAAYAAFGAAPAVAMVVNAALGATVAWAAFDLLASATSRTRAVTGGLAVALHPALVAYTPAIMTEGVTAALLLVAAAFAVRARACCAPNRPRARAGWIIATGLLFGFLTLVRPQVLVLAPVFGWLSVMPGAGFCIKNRLKTAFFVTALALLVCAPWTARNGLRMHRAALVSMNGGWNLAIGTQTTTGGFQALEVPETCKTVFEEAAKDTCFGHEALRVIRSHPVAWLLRMPAKIRMTFDYFGAAPWYLHEAQPLAFSYRAKVWLGGVETVVSRIFLIAALVSVRALGGPRLFVREAVAGVGIVAAFTQAGALAYLACALAVVLLGPKALVRAPLVVPVTAFAIVATAVTHAIFFGAGRYGLVVVPLVTVLAFVSPSWAACEGDKNKPSPTA